MPDLTHFVSISNVTVFHPTVLTQAQTSIRSVSTREIEDPDRPALRAGDPRSWSILVKDTLLDGEPYSPPPLPRRGATTAGEPPA
jgi:hypothetical protein